MIINFRQGLITSPVNFLIASGGYAHINIDQVPLLACVSNAQSDYLIEESASVNRAWGPINNSATYYLFWDINRVTGQITRGMTQLSPLTSDDAPAAPQVGQMWWDYSLKKMNEWNGNRWVEVLRVFAGELTGASIRMYDAGSQAGIFSVGTPGKIVFDGYGKPLRRQDGNFLTSETELTLPQSGSLVKLDGAFITAKANENLPKNSLVYFVPNTTDRVGLASGIYPDVETKTPIGLVQVATYMNEPVNLITAGKLVQDEQWNWNIADIGKPVYCDATGGLTLARSGEKTMRIGTVFSQKSVMLSFDWETQPSTVAGEVVNIHAVEPVYVTGSDAAPVVNVRTVSTSNDGALSAAQFTTISDAIAEIPNKSNIGHQHAIADTTGLQTALDGKAALVHTHVAADVTDLQPLLDAKSDVGHGHTIGDVAGLSSALAGKSNINHVHAIAGVTGLQTELDNKAPLNHTHVISDTSGLQAALDIKANVGHIHAITDVTGLQSALDNKANISHNHVIASVLNLQTELDSKALLNHNHFMSDVQGLSAALDGKSNVGHQHAIADTTGLQSALDSKSDVGHNHAIGEITGLQIVLDNKSDIDHTHALEDLSNVNITHKSSGDVLTWSSDGFWTATAPSGGGGSAVVGMTEIAFGNEIDGTLTSSSVFKYNNTNNSLHVNVPPVVNEQAEIILYSGDNIYNYGHAQLTLSTAFGVGASNAYLQGGDANIDTSLVDWPGNETPEIRGGDVYVLAGNSLQGVGFGGRLYLNGGNASGAARGGDVSINGGQAGDIANYGDINLFARSIHLDTINGMYEISVDGEFKVGGNAGNFGDVLTSAGPGQQPSWQPAGGGGFTPPGPGFVVVDPSMQVQALSDSGWPAIAMSQNGITQMLDAGPTGTVLTSAGQWATPYWAASGGPSGQAFRFRAFSLEMRGADGITYDNSWTDVNTYTGSNDVFYNGSFIAFNNTTPTTWLITVQTTLRPRDLNTEEWLWPVSTIKYGTEIFDRSGGGTVNVNLGSYTKSSHIAYVADADAKALMDTLSWTDTYTVQGQNDVFEISIGTYAAIAAGMAVDVQYEVTMNVTVTHVGPSEFGG